MTYIYDGTFEGLLSVIFKIYEQKKPADKILREAEQQDLILFNDSEFIETSPENSERVMKGLQKRVSGEGIKNIYKAFLTEKKDVELLIYFFIKYMLEQKRNVETDFSNSHVLKLRQLAKMVDREVHRMHAFVRFKLTKDGIYGATINPDFDVIPLIGSHFKNRYSDQQWMIYDVRRNYGLFYNLRVLETITIDQLPLDQQEQIKDDVLADEELKFQGLWKTYFSSTNIKERENMKLHLQHVPKRYWNFLVEK